MTFIHPVGKNNRERVLGAIIDLGGSATPKKIQQYSFLKERDNLEENDPEDSSKSKDNLAAKNAMKERTVKGWLKILTDEGILKNNRGLYSIHDKIKSDYRYFGRRFGRAALYRLMSTHYPATNTLPDNTRILVEIFGTFVLYCLIEASRSFDLADAGNNSDDINKRVSSWVQGALNPWSMFAYFISIMKYQPDDKKVMKYRGTSRKERMAYLPFIDSDNEKPIFDSDEMMPVLDKRIIDYMLKEIKAMHPKYYEQLSVARERILLELNQGIGRER